MAKSSISLSRLLVALTFQILSGVEVGLQRELFDVLPSEPGQIMKFASQFSTLIRVEMTPIFQIYQSSLQISSFWIEAEGSVPPDLARIFLSLVQDPFPWSGYLESGWAFF